MTNLACVFGNPIAQSKSPQIHAAFAKQCGIELSYTRNLAEINQFRKAADDFFAQSESVGANVTMPFKHDALEWVDELSTQASRAGAVNTIVRRSDKFVGDNTDGLGLVSDLNRLGLDLHQKRVLMIGAGGAAKGAIPALVDAGVSHLQIQNRSAEKAQELTDVVNRYAPKLACCFGSQTLQVFDLVVNATSLSMHNELPDIPNSVFEQAPMVYDMVYANSPTVFMRHAKKIGNCDTADGLGMLVGQAAHSFNLWFGKMPNTREVLAQLREEA